MIIWIVLPWPLVPIITILVSVSEGCIANLRIAAPAALLTMPDIVCWHAVVATRTEDVKIIVHVPAEFTRLVFVPFGFPALVVLGIDWTAESLVH